MTGDTAYEIVPESMATPAKGNGPLSCKENVQIAFQSGFKTREGRDLRDAILFRI
jgi:hypothetical protein